MPPARAAAFDPADAGARKAVLKQRAAAFTRPVDFVGSDKSLNFATGVLAKGGKVVVTGLIGGGYSTAVAMFPLKAMTIEGTKTGTLAEARELMDLVRANNIAAAADQRAPARRARSGARRSARRQVIGRVVLMAKTLSFATTFRNPVPAFRDHALRHNLLQIRPAAGRRNFQCRASYALEAFGGQDRRASA